MQGGCRVGYGPNEGSRGNDGDNDRNLSVIPVQVYSDNMSTKEETAKICGMICAYDQTCEAFEFFEAPAGHDTFTNGSCEIWIVRPNHSTMIGEYGFCYRKKESGGHYTAKQRIKMEVTFDLPDTTNFTNIDYAEFRNAFQHQDLDGMHAKLCRRDFEVTLVMWNDHNNGTRTVQEMQHFFKPLNPPEGNAGTGKGRLFTFRNALKAALGLIETPAIKDDGRRKMKFINNAASCGSTSSGWMEMWDSGDPAPTEPPEDGTKSQESDSDAAMMGQCIDVFVVVLCAIFFSN